MEKTDKQLYEAPSMMMIEMLQQSMLCASGDTERFTEGESYGNDDFE